jgi:hypothetical protein
MLRTAPSPRNESELNNRELDAGGSFLDLRLLADGSGAEELKRLDSFSQKGRTIAMPASCSQRYRFRIT